MRTSKSSNEEKNIRRVILLSSTFIVLFVSIIVAYLLISFEIKEFKDHLKTFNSTLIKREKFAIQAIVNNLVNDIKYVEISRTFEIKKRIKNQIDIVTLMIKSIILQNKNKNRKQVIRIIENRLKKISKKDGIDFFIFDKSGTLLLPSKTIVYKGKNYLDFQDLGGNYFVKQIIQKSGYIEYLWFIPKSSKLSKKITYSKKIKKLGIIIGCGEFLNTSHSINQKIIDKLNREKLSKREFVFVYDILSLSSSKNFAKLIFEKNIITNKKEIIAINNILVKSDYKGNIYYKYNNKLTYSKFLFNNKIFISAGVDLNYINNILKKETKISYQNLNKKIISLIINILAIAIIFFIFSYILAQKIEKKFKNYRLRVAKSQQLLIQKSKMASMGEMIGNIAHQWRQPLTQLSGLFFDIESAFDYGELDKKYMSKRTDEANDLIEYMSKTIDDFKEFFSPVTKMEHFSIYENIHRALKIIDSSFKFYNINVDINVDKSLKINGYANEFAQVILNILSNSKDIAIQRKIKEPRIYIYSEVKDKNIFLYIKDNCGGIDEKIIDKIFEPYFTTKYNYGTGIGLYMSKIIIENKMDGKIKATSDGKNAIFTITFKK